jgi:hypothetical protein
MITSASNSSLIRALAGLAFMCGVMGSFLLQTITFVSGPPYTAFITCGILTLSGLLLRAWHYRIASIVLVIFCTVAAIDSHTRGVAYEKQRMAKKPALVQSS